jgi:hypothetical protein
MILNDRWERMRKQVGMVCFKVLTIIVTTVTASWPNQKSGSKRNVMT